MRAELRRRGVFDAQVLGGVGDDRAHVFSSNRTTGVSSGRLRAYHDNPVALANEIDRFEAEAVVSAEDATDGALMLSMTSAPKAERAEEQVGERTHPSFVWPRRLCGAGDRLLGRHRPRDRQGPRRRRRPGRRQRPDGEDASKRRSRVRAPPARDVLAAPFDVTDPSERQAAARIEAEFGPIDILVNNAGIQRRGPLEDYPEETWRELMRANLDSVFFVLAGRRAVHDRAQAGQDHQHRLGSGGARASEHRALHRLQGRGEDADQGHGDGLGQARPQGQRASRQGISGPSSTRPWWRTRTFPPGSTSARRWAGWGDVEALVGAAIFLLPTPRVSSMATFSMSTAALRLAFDGPCGVVACSDLRQRPQAMIGFPALRAKRVPLGRWQMTEPQKLILASLLDWR